MKLLLGLLLPGLLLPGFCRAQTTIESTEPIDAKLVRSWVVKDAADYAGVYHFGVSEVESDFVLCVQPGGLLTAQVQSAHWSGKRFLPDYTTLRNVRIVGNTFYADHLSGDFIRYTDTDGKPAVGLRVRQPWSASVEKNQWEVGPRYADLATHFDHPYGYVSYRLLQPLELQGRSKTELALMRNELFARYGFIFTKGGAMDQHFRRLSWYQPQHHDVSKFLTDIERRNLEQIRRQEAAR